MCAAAAAAESCPEMNSAAALLRAAGCSQRRGRGGKGKRQKAREGKTKRDKEGEASEKADVTNRSERKRLNGEKEFHSGNKTPVRQNEL